MFVVIQFVHPSLRSAVIVPVQKGRLPESVWAAPRINFDILGLFSQWYDAASAAVTARLVYRTVAE